MMAMLINKHGNNRVALNLRGLLLVLFMGLLLTGCSSSSGEKSTKPAQGQPAGSPKVEQAGPAGSQQGAAPAPAVKAPEKKEPTKLTVVKVAVPRKTFGYLPLYVGLNQGAFAKEGLDVQVVEMAANIQVAGLLSGDIDIAGAGSSVMRAATQGGDVRTIVFTYAKSNFQLVAKPEIKTVADLKGKVIGITTIGSSTHMASLLTVSHFKMNPEKDVNFIAVGAGAQAFAAMESGAVDASMLNSDEAAMLNKKGFPTIFAASEIMDTPFSGFGAATKTLNEKAPEVKAWLKGFINSLIFTRDNPQKVVEIAIKEFKMEPDVAEIAVKGVLPSIGPGIPGGASPEGLKKLIEQDIMGPMKLTEPIPADKLVDFRLLQEVQKGINK